MRIVLVNPMLTLAGWDSYRKAGQPGMGTRELCSLPHGLLHIATELNRIGHACAVVDLRSCVDMQDALDKVIRHRPDVVGCGAMTVDFTHLVTLFAHLKEQFPQATTIAGGVHVSVATDQAAKHECIDYIVTGEAEWTLAKMLDANFVGFPRIVHGTPVDVDLLLPIDRELMDYRNGELMNGCSWGAEAPYVTVITSRGCPYRCRFCAPVSETMFGEVRQRSVSHVIDECRWLQWRYGARYFEFIDDYFTHRPEYVEEFCAGWETWLGKTPFNVATRADTIVKHEGMFVRMKEVGLHTVNVGFESGSDYVLKFLGKGTTSDLNREAGAILNRLGVKIMANVIFGVPDESLSDSWATITMVREMNADYVSAAYFTPYPGCELHEQYKDDLVSEETATLDRHATRPKLKSVDYTALQALINTELKRHLSHTGVLHARQ